MIREGDLDHYKGLHSKAIENNEWNAFTRFTSPESVTATEVLPFELPKSLRPATTDRILKLDFLLPGLLLNCNNQRANLSDKKSRRKWYFLSCGRRRNVSEYKTILVSPRASTIQKKNCWNQIQSCQKPSNGDIWYRLSSRRVQFVILIDSKGHDKTPNSDDNSSGISSLSPNESTLTSFQLSECEIKTPHYYYWDSGDLVHSVDPELYRLLMKNNRMIFCVAIPGYHRKTTLWSTDELRRLEAGYQDTANISDLYQTHLDSLKIVDKTAPHNDDGETDTALGLDYQGEQFEVVLERDCDVPLGIVLSEQFIPKFTTEHSNSFRVENPPTSIFIKALTPGGLVEQTGKVKVGDRLVAVNAVSLLMPLEQCKDRCGIKPRTSMPAQTEYGGDTSVPVPGLHSSQDACTFAMCILNQAISPIRLILERCNFQQFTTVQPHPPAYEANLQHQSCSYTDHLNENARLDDEPSKTTPVTSDYNQPQETEVDDSTTLLEDHETETKSNSKLERNKIYPSKEDLTLSRERIKNGEMFYNRQPSAGQTNEKSTTTNDLTKIEESRIPILTNSPKYRHNLQTEAFDELLCSRKLFGRTVRPKLTEKFLQWLEDSQNDTLKHGRFSELSSRYRPGETGQWTTSGSDQMANSKNYRQNTNPHTSVVNTDVREQTKIPVLREHGRLREANLSSPITYKRLSEISNRRISVKHARTDDLHNQTASCGKDQQCPPNIMPRRARHLVKKENTLNYRLARLEDCLSKHVPPLPMPDSPLSVNSDEVHAFHNILENLTETEWQGLLHVVDSSDGVTEDNDDFTVPKTIEGLRTPKDGHGDIARGKVKNQANQRRYHQPNRISTRPALGS